MRGLHTGGMRWWDRTLAYLADYIAVYGWADPTSTMPPTWVDGDCGDSTVDDDGDAICAERRSVTGGE